MKYKVLPVVTRFDNKFSVFLLLLLPIISVLVTRTYIVCVDFGMFLFKFQKPDDEEAEILNHEEDFSLPQDYFVKEE
jgi:hypothetical protein